MRLEKLRSQRFEVQIINLFVLLVVILRLCPYENNNYSTSFRENVLRNLKLVGNDTH
jgi:hypothetical protein